MEKENMMIYGLLVVAVLVLAWSAMGALQSNSQPATLQNTPQNYQNYEALRQQSAASGGDECGDLTDPANVQHLSHHENLKPCLDKVDPALRQQVLGGESSHSH